ncbi:MAG: hypothetical protein ABR887_04510 [Methanoregulaceae archaeon]|jgi:hypothetical protein
MVWSRGLFTTNLIKNAKMRIGFSIGLLIMTGTLTLGFRLVATMSDIQLYPLVEIWRN